MFSLRLTTPAQQKSAESIPESNPSELEKSLKDLQQATMLDRINLLDASITRCNEIKLDAGKRIKVLEIYFKAYQKLLQGFDEMRIVQLNISSQQKRQVKKDTMWLYLKLSHGYKIIVKQFAAKDPEEKPNRDTILACFRAMELTFTSLLYSYRFDIEEPPFCHLEINQLYAFAEHFGIAGKTVRGADGYAKTPTVQSYYILVQIFLNLDPRQYESYTLEVLLLALQPFIFKCGILPKLSYKDSSHYYQVNLNENQPATILLDDKVTALSKETRYINIDAFMEEIQAWLKENECNENSLLIEQELELFPAIVTRFKINHSQKPAKAKTETNNGGKVKNEICKLIIGLAPLESLLIMDTMGIDIHLNFNESDWLKMNETDNGCELLSCGDGYHEFLSLGELVAIVEDESIEQQEIEQDEYGNPKLRKVAQIIGLRQVDNDNLLLELEYIPGKAKPLTYRRLTSDNKNVDYNSSIGVCIENDKNPEIPPQLVLSNQHFRQDQHYLIVTRESGFAIEACDLLKRSMLYSYFSYKVIQANVSDPGIASEFKVKRASNGD